MIKKQEMFLPKSDYILSIHFPRITYTNASFFIKSFKIRGISFPRTLLQYWSLYKHLQQLHTHIHTLKWQTYTQAIIRVHIHTHKHLCTLLSHTHTHIFRDSHGHHTYTHTNMQWKSTHSPTAAVMCIIATAWIFGNVF